MAVKVELEPHEVEVGSYVGQRRRCESMRKNLRNNSHIEAQFENDIQSSCAEMAFAKGTDRYWTAGINTFKTVGDVGEQKIEVRSTPNRNYGLIVYPDDPDDRMYVLMIGKIPEFWIIGYIQGAKAKQQQWFRKDKGYYIVPQSSLTPYNKTNNKTVKQEKVHQTRVAPKPQSKNLRIVDNEFFVDNEITKN